MRYKRRIVISCIQWWKLFDICHEFEKSCESILKDMEKTLFPEAYKNGEIREN